MNLPKDQWVWMPHAAHLIVGNDCTFKLATYVGGYIVSTVGEYDPDSNVKRITAESRDPQWYAENRHLKGDYFDAAHFTRFGWETIGVDRIYETMVFAAVPRDYPCGCAWGIDSGNEVDFDSYNDPADAYAGHMAMCERWAAGGDAV